MNFHFLPALTLDTKWSPGGSASMQRIRSDRTEEALVNWMDERIRGTSAFYPHVLISYYGLRDIPLQLPEDGFILGDSGGFSVTRYRIEGLDPIAGIDPIDVLRWQARLCRVGVIIDVPPIDLHGNQKWETGLEGTLQTVRRSVSLYEEMKRENLAPRFRWWGVVHGWTDKQRDLWWREVSQIYPFTDEGEGWAIRARPTAHDPISIAWCLRWLGMKGITHTHFFAALGSTSSATIIVLGPRAGLEFATVDSTGMISTYARNRGIMIPDNNGLSYTTIKESIALPIGVDRSRRTYREARDYCLEKCTCFACKDLQEKAKDAQHPIHLGKGEKRWVLGASLYWNYYFEFHNLLVMKSVVENQKKEAARDPDKMLREILGDKYGQVIRAFEGQEATRTQTGTARSLLDWID